MARRLRIRLALEELFDVAQVRGAGLATQDPVQRERRAEMDSVTIVRRLEASAECRDTRVPVAGPDGYGAYGATKGRDESRDAEAHRQIQSPLGGGQTRAGIVFGSQPGRVEGRPEDREGEAGRFGEKPACLDRPEPLTRPADIGQRRPLGHEKIGQHRHKIEPLGKRKRRVGGGDGFRRAGEEELGAGELRPERDPRRICRQVRILLRGGRDEREGSLRVERVEHHSSELRGRPAHRDPIASRTVQHDGLFEEGPGRLVRSGSRGSRTGTLEQLTSFLPIRRDRQRLFEEPRRLGIRAERRGPVGRRPQRDPRLGREGIRLWARGTVRMGREIMAGQSAGELVAAEALEEAGRGEVAALAIGAGQRVVRHFPDQGLDERVLAALGTPRIRLEGE